MAFVFLNIDLNIGGFGFGLFPSFLGYLFILKGLTELSGLSIRFYKMTPTVLLVGAYSAVMYFMELMGGLGTGWLNYVLILISINLSLFVSYNFIMGIQDIEVHRGQNLNFAQLFFAWKVLAIFAFMPLVARIVPMPAILPVAAGLAVGIYFLFVLDRTRRSLYLHNPVE